MSCKTAEKRSLQQRSCIRGHSYVKYAHNQKLTNQQKPVKRLAHVTTIIVFGRTHFNNTCAGLAFSDIYYRVYRPTRVFRYRAVRGECYVETLESVFVSMWRTTGDVKLREHEWELSIEKKRRASSEYTSVRTSVGPIHIH